jgi:hypothetical protein
MSNVNLISLFTENNQRLRMSDILIGDGAEHHSERTKQAPLPLGMMHKGFAFSVNFTVECTAKANLNRIC